MAVPIKENSAEMIHRREMARAAALDREDLFLLMESYQNTISLNTTLLERQDTLNLNIERTLKELVGICQGQARIIEEVRALNAANQASAKEVIEEVAAGRLGEVKEHSAHNNRIYVALVGMVVIIASLIGALLKGAP